MITRTFNSSKVTVMGVDTISAEVENKTVILSSVADEAKALKLAKKALDTDEFKVVKVVEITNIETLRGMSEEQFLELSVELDPVTRKPIK